MKAEIELLTLQKGEVADLSARLPPAEAFRKANIDYSGALLSVKFSIEPRGEDRYVVVLSSKEPINEPFLDLLVELDWNTGRLVREYTFLLDPPEYKAPEAAPAIAAPVSGTPAIRSVEMPKQPEPVARPPSADQAPAVSAPAMATAAKPTASYEVKRGDTLTKIANANRTDRVSLQQMLIALYRSNADLFDDSNINRIRAGKILNIPDMDTAAAIDEGEARRTVLAHAADFNEYRRKLAAAVSAAPERADQQRQRVSGKITAKVEDKPVKAKAEDQLKLSKGEEPGTRGAKRSPQGVQEDLLAKEKELAEANERIALLEKNVKDMQKLLELKSQSGAQLQQQAEKAGMKPAEPAQTPPPAKAPEAAKPAAPAKAAEPAQAPAAMQAPEPAKVAPKPEAAAPKPKPKPKIVAPPPPPPEVSLIDEILGNELAVFGGGGFLLLLFVGYGYYAWKRKKTLQMESSVMAQSELAVDSVFGAAGGAKVDTDAGEGRGDMGQAATTATMETEEVDPIAEADVYMAYGRDTQAEEILKDAIAKDPTRQAIRGKLLEIYANRKDAAAFGAVATELREATGGEGPEWTKAVALGAQLDPGNALYGGAGAAEAQASADTQVVGAAETAPDIVLDTGAEASAGLDFDLGMGEQAPDVAAQPEAAPTAEVTADLGFDLDLGEAGSQAAPQAQPSAPAGSVEEKPAEAAADAGSSIDFDFELPGAGAEKQPTAEAAAPELPQAEAAPEASAQGGGGIDFDFNLDLPAAEKEEAPAAPLDLSAISLDLGAPGETAAAGAQPDAHWQEVATKLDLAKAYQEMGDKDGARELLNEVLKEGDEAQQQQAQALLAALG